MQLLSLLLFSLVLATSASASTVKIRCDGTSHSHQFKSLFSLDILLDGESQVHLSEGKEPELTNVTNLQVLAKHGDLTPGKPVLKAAVDVDCSMVDKLECELYGLLAQNMDFKKVRFKPRIHFDDTIRNGCIEGQKKTYRINEVTLVTCSANVGTNHTKWRWQVHIEGEQVTRKVDHKNIQTFPSKLKKCTYHTVSRLIYINEDPGQVTFKCQIGDTVVGSVSAVVDREILKKNREALGTVLFLSTTILVYTHFIYLPCIFARWNKIFTYRDDVLKLKWRTIVSYILGMMFFIVWSVTYALCRDADHVTCYLAFAIIELIFILVYATLRLHSKFIIQNWTTERIGLLNTARVCFSFGAVLVPVISWIIIRIQGGTGNFPLGQLSLDIQPSIIDVQDNKTVMIRCSMDLSRPKTDMVYSVMIRRRQTTSAVLFGDGSYEISDKHVTLERFLVNRSTAILELNLQNITCVDRGDYSCKMAVRRSHRNLQLGPVTSHLTVIGEPSGVFLVLDPEKTSYTVDEKVHVTCSTLQRMKIKDWTWFLGNQSFEGKTGTCIYSDSDCLFKCSSTMSHYLSMDDEKTEFVCGIGAMSSKRTVDVTNDSVSTLSAKIDEIDTQSPKETRNKVAILLIISIVVTIAVITGIVFILILGRRRLADVSLFSTINGSGRIKVRRKKDHIVDQGELITLT